MDCLSKTLLRHVAKHPVSKATRDHLQGRGARQGIRHPVGPKDYFRPPPVIVIDCTTGDADAVNAFGVG
jgi:hypothetical protein